MAKKKKDKQPKLKLGFSPVQATASGAGTHEKKGRWKRRDDRRKRKIRDRQGEYE